MATILLLVNRESDSGARLKYLLSPDLLVPMHAWWREKRA
jgi:hypothetical protein